MANVKLSFYGSEKSRTTEHRLECYANTNKELFISIEKENSDCYDECFISLDKSTAIKLSKEIRKQIALLED